MASLSMGLGRPWPPIVFSRRDLSKHKKRSRKCYNTNSRPPQFVGPYRDGLELICYELRTRHTWLGGECARVDLE